MTGGMPDATMTRTCRKLRSTVLGPLSHERFRAMVREVSSVGPAPRSPAGALCRTAGPWKTPGRGAYVYERLPRSDDGQVSRPAPWMTCHVSASGSHDGGSRRDGRCTWCGRRFQGAAPEPELGHTYRTELGQAYRYHHDPDWGTDPYDL